MLKVVALAILLGLALSISIDFENTWNDNKKKVGEIAAEIIAGKKRFERVVATREGRGENWHVIGELREDIYPVVGGKHKKWFIYGAVIDKNGIYQEKKWENERPGYNVAIEPLWNQVKLWISMVSGDPSPVFNNVSTN
jgi:hypothetical protein